MSDEVIDVVDSKSEVTAEEAKAVLEAENQKKLADCGKEVSDVLEKYGFSLKIEHMIQIVPKQ